MPLAVKPAVPANAAAATWATANWQTWTPCWFDRQLFAPAPVETLSGSGAFGHWEACLAWNAASGQRFPTPAGRGVACRLVSPGVACCRVVSPHAFLATRVESGCAGWSCGARWSDTRGDSRNDRAAGDWSAEDRASCGCAAQAGEYAHRGRPERRHERRGCGQGRSHSQRMTRRRSGCAVCGHATTIANGVAIF